MLRAEEFVTVHDGEQPEWDMLVVSKKWMEMVRKPSDVLGPVK